MTRNKNDKTLTQTSVQTETSEKSLSWEEEMVVRMRNGFSADGDAELEFHGQYVEEPRARLAMMEAELLAMMHSAGPLAQPEEQDEPTLVADDEARQRILNRFKKK